MGIKTIGRFTLDSSTAVAVSANANIIFPASTVSTDAIAYNSTTGQIQIKCPGVYKITANFTPVATVVGKVDVYMQENGVSVPGAKASDNIATVGDYANLAFSAVTTVRKSNSNNYATLTFLNSTATSYTVANVIIEKVA